MFINSFKTLDIYKNIYEKDDNGREINIYKIENSKANGINLSYPNVLFFNGENLILPLLEKTMSLGKSYYQLNDMKFEIEKSEIKKEYNEPLFFFCYNLGNYYHFLYDTLPYLISYLELKKEIKNLKLLTNYPKYRFVLEFLELLNIREEDLVIIDDKTKYKEIYISTSYTHDIDSNLAPRKEIFDFYQSLTKNIKVENFKLYDKIYISRRTHLHNKLDNIGTNYTTRRKLVNEDQLVEKLTKEGYQEIFAENLTTKEKILLFNNAKYVCGCIGGGIANVVFSKREAKLEAIISPGFLDINNRFKYCLDWVNVKYNFNTSHLEKGEFKKYMRVRFNDMIGEIEDYDDNNIYVKLSTNDIVGWDNENKLKISKINKKDVNKLDNGLNSPFIFLLRKCG